MKIRKANVQSGNDLITNVYIYENKKQEFSLIAIPDIEWSTIVAYEEEREEVRNRLTASLIKTVEPDVAEELVAKLIFWVGEM
ncbi:YueH family protein [Metabacillus malikii]|uniref:YueH-like protein n=1 Tax=Metabacillus malikii TaxID=1504265 RepID=A0ABT9ZBW8_9BACI|nr:YueH family protein [Metabacillus malikii]MDQ0229766.1 hypothetical protein [Metabacillus malikii]